MRPTSKVSAEDILHMRNRVQEYVFTHTLARDQLVDIKPCPQCFAQRLVQKSIAWDARPEGPIPQPASATGSCSVRGFTDLMQSAHVNSDAAATLLQDLQSLGALSVSELTLSDWQGTSAWAQLRPLEQRRLSRALGFASRP